MSIAWLVDAGANTDDSTCPKGLADSSAEAVPGGMKATPIIPPTTSPANISVLLCM
ncbi:MAG: hypothetical protein QGI76_05745 [Dehalococcoidia bacterium]|nr:hypothetical protein [Dehalococcoidia bacterium]